MGRSTKKGPYIDEKLQKKVLKLNESGEKKVIKTWARSAIVTPDYVGHTLAVHNGKNSCRSTSRNRWSATSSASSRRRVSSGVTGRRTRKA